MWSLPVLFFSHRKPSSSIHFQTPILESATESLNPRRRRQSSARSPAGAIFTRRGMNTARTSTRSFCAAITAWMSL